MRIPSYRAFELLAWPAAVAASVEVVLLLATSSLAGLAETLLVAACATGTITAARLRRFALQERESRVPAHRDARV